MDGLTMNDKHEYYFCGNRVPNVTSILESVGIVDYSMVKERHRQHGMEKGSNVHLACQYYNEGQLDWNTLPEEIEGYARSWDAICRTTGFEPLMNEFPYYSKRYGFAGTLDVMGLLNGRKVIMDYKSCAVPRWTELQTSAYSQLLLEYGVAVPERYGVELKSDGNIGKLSGPYTDINDFAVFASALGVYMWKNK